MHANTSGLMERRALVHISENTFDYRNAPHSVRFTERGWVKIQPIPRWFKIYTTLDSRMQEFAEKSSAKHMSELQGKFYKHWKDYKDEKPWGDDDMAGRTKVKK